MRILDGEQRLVRIFFRASDYWRHEELATALLERLRREGFAGATLVRGAAGFGASGVHSDHLLRMDEDPPVFVEIVDAPQEVKRLLPILDEMFTGGLVTVEKVRVLKYGPGRPPAKKPKG